MVVGVVVCDFCHHLLSLIHKSKKRKKSWRRKEELEDILGWDRFLSNEETSL